MGAKGIRRIALLAYPLVDVLDVAGPSEVFGATQRALAAVGGSGEAGYSVELLSSSQGARNRNGQRGEAAGPQELPRTRVPDRYADRGRRLGRPGSGEGPGSAQMVEAHGAESQAPGFDLHRRIRAGSRGAPRRPAGDHPLEMVPAARLDALVASLSVSVD